MKKMKKYVALALAGIMALSVIACGNGDSESGTSANGKNDKNKSTTGVGKDVVYSVKQLEDLSALTSEYGSINDMVVVGDKIYAIIQEYNNNGEKSRYVQMDLEANILNEFTIYENIYEVYDGDVNGDVVTDDMLRSAAGVTEEVLKEEAMEENPEEIKSYIYQYELLSDGTLTYIEEFPMYNEETGMQEGDYFFEAIGTDGTELFSINLREEFSEEDDTYINNIMESGHDTLYLCNSTTIFEVDFTGAIVTKAPTTEVTMWMDRPLFYQDGYPVIGVWNAEYTERTYQTVDVMAGKVVAEVDVLDSLENYSYSDGGESGYEFILSNATSIYGYNIGDTEPTELMNMIASDIASRRLNNVCYVNETQFIATYYDAFTDKLIAGIFTKVPPEDVVDKETLTLACHYMGTDLLKQVVSFNEANSTYKILVKDYSTFNTMDDYEAGITQLKNDIIAGNAPDIIMDNSDSIPMDNYASKGLFVDLYELMEADESFNKEDYAQNVLKAYEVKGALYQIPTFFSIQTIFAKTSIVGDDHELTWDEFHAILAKYPEAESFTMMDQTQMLATALNYGYENYIDRETNEVHFDSDDFKNMLSFVATFPEEINWDEVYNGDEDYWMTSQSQYIEDRTLFMMSGVYDMSYLYENTYGQFLEQTTPIGFPTAEGMGSVLSARSSFAISAKAANIDVAWEFVKTFFTEEYQMPVTEEEEAAGMYKSSNGLPMYIPALEASAKKMTQKPYWYDQDGNKEEYELTTWINGEEVNFDPATQEEVDKIVAFVQSVDKRVSYTEVNEITEIIQEEAAAFFSGQKSVDEVANIIQSRMSIYISENS